MRIVKWYAITVVLFGLSGTCLGLMSYSLAGFPMGCAAGVADAQAGALRILLGSLLFVAFGLGMAIMSRRLNANSANQKEDSGGGDQRLKALSEESAIRSALQLGDGRFHSDLA